MPTLIPPQDGQGQVAPVWSLNFRQQQRDLAALFSEAKPIVMREAVKGIAEKYATEYATRVKNILADEASDTGRLAASYGPYKPSYLHAGYREALSSIGINMPVRGTTYRDKPSDESDSLFYEETRGNVYFWNVGSYVDYAVPIMMGFTQWGGQKVYVPRYGQWITVRPFQFRGIHADDRALSSLESEPEFLDGLVGDALKEVFG